MLPVSNNPRCKVGGRLDVTLADEISEVAETKILSEGTFRLPIKTDFYQMPFNVLTIKRSLHRQLII